MIFRKAGFSLLEVIIVIIIIGVCVAFGFPNYITSTELARTANARNNLMAIYSAEQNYNNNNGSYCYNTGAGSCDNIADINTKLGLQIQDDGTYTFNCPNASSTCTATRSVAAGAPAMTLTMSSPINISGSGVANPTCADGTHTPSWCPP
jgi:prepilin-type N-terminal cleavage/methylation domain-containing protein